MLAQYPTKQSRQELMLKAKADLEDKLQREVTMKEMMDPLFLYCYWYGSDDIV